MGRLAAVVLLAGAVVVAGCGGGNGPSSGDDDPGGSVYTQGPILVQPQTSASFRVTTLGGSQASNCSFLAFHGSTINRLAYQPAPGRLLGLTTAGLKVARDNGTGAVTILDDGDSARWSPVGDRIAVCDTGRLYLVAPDGSRLERHMAGGLAVQFVCWAPGGQTLYVAAREGTQYDLFQLNASGGGVPVQLTDDAAYEYDLDCSPNGQVLVMARSAGGGDDREIVLFDRATKAQTPITADTVQEDSPRWSPDGRYIVFEREGELLLFDVFANSATVLVGDVQSGVGPTWSADGSCALYIDPSSGDLCSAPVTGGTPTVLQADFGVRPDLWAPVRDRRRTFVGPARSDWGGKAPPFGASRPAAVVALSDGGLKTAVSFTGVEGRPFTINNRTPSGADDLVIAEVRSQQVQKVVRDEGAGIPTTLWNLGQSGQFPTAAVLAFSADQGWLTSVIPVWETATGEAAQGASSVQVEAQGGRIIIRGEALQAYDGSGGLRSGATRVQEVVLDGRTGEVVGG